MHFLLLWRVVSIKSLQNFKIFVTLSFSMEEEEEKIETKDINPDTLDEALGDIIIIEDDEEEIYFNISPDDDLDIAFSDEDTRDWI